MKKFLILSLIFFLVGCDYTELNELDIVTAAAIDFENNQYILNYAISNATKNNTEEPLILEGKGKTISEAISDMSLTSAKEIYIGHMRDLIIAEEVARKGLLEASDYFFRNQESKKTFQILIAKESKAKDILKIITKENNLKNNNIIKNLTSEGEENAKVINNNFLSFLKAIKSPGVEATANGIRIIKLGEEETIKIDSLAIFKDDKMVNWALPDFIPGLTILNKETSSVKVKVVCDNGNAVFNLKDLSVKKSFEIKRKVTFKFQIQGQAEISEMSCLYDLNKEESIKLLEQSLINKMKSVLEDTTQIVKTSKIDSLGIGLYIYQNDYQNWQKIKDNYLDNLEVEFVIIPNLLKKENTNEGTLK